MLGFRRGRAWIVALATGGSLLVAGGCSGTSDDTQGANGSTASPSRIKPLPSDRPSLPTLGDARPTSSSGWDATVAVNAVRRGPNGLAVLYWTLTNTGSEFVVDGAFVPKNNYERAEYYGGGPSAVTLTASQSDQRYHTLRDTAKTCFCSHIIAGYDSYAIVKGESLTLFNTFKLPADVKSVTVDIPGFKPVKNVPVRGS